MFDLYLGIAIMLALMVVCFALALWVTRKAHRFVCDVLAVLTVLGIAVYARWIWDDTLMATILPFSNLVIVSNWFPLATGFLAGLVWQRIRARPQGAPPLSPAVPRALTLASTEGAEPVADPQQTAPSVAPPSGGQPSRARQIFVRARQLGAAAVLSVAAIYTLIRPLQGKAPVCDTNWQGDWCLQTSKSTCSAAAAATLLQCYGVYASEQEMAELCLTRVRESGEDDSARESNLLSQALKTRSGTSWKGLYRGLTLKAREFGHRVEVFDASFDELRGTFTDPCILECELRLDDAVDAPDYEQRGWVPGQSHSVVLWNFSDDGLAIVADPSGIAEVWERKDFETLWHGQGLRIVPRSQE